MPLSIDERDNDEDSTDYDTSIIDDEDITQQLNASNNDERSDT